MAEGDEPADLSGDALKGTSFEGATVPAAFVKDGKPDVASILAAASRPDPLAGVEVPTKFVKDGKASVADLARGYRELEQAQFRRREEVTKELRESLEAERRAAAPATPGDYKAPDKWKVGEGSAAREFSIDHEDPVFKYFAGVAHEMHLSQADFEKAIKGYTATMVSTLPDWTVESAALGPNAEKRLGRVDGWLKGNLSAENYGYFARMPASAAQIKAFEELMTLAGLPPIVGDGENVDQDVLTLPQLKEMQRDPRYTGEKGRHDQAFVNKVRQGFRQLARKAGG